jgi:hypothetical protein
MQVGANVTKEHTAFIISAENGGTMSFRNIGTFLQVHTALHPRRPTWIPSPWESHVTFRDSFCYFCKSCHINSQLQLHKIWKKVKQLTKNIYNGVNLTEFPRVNVFGTWGFVASECKVHLPLAGAAAVSQEPSALQAAVRQPMAPAATTSHSQSATEAGGEVYPSPVKRKCNPSSEGRERPPKKISRQ